MARKNKKRKETKQIGPAIAAGIGQGIQWTNHLYQFISIILLLKFSGELLPEVITGSDKIGEIAGLPLSSIFTGGIITIIIMAVIITTTIKNANRMAK